MISEFVITNDGKAIFSCQGDMKGEISSVEFYSHTGNFVFNYEDSGLDQDMLDIEISPEHRDQILTLSNALIAWVENGDIKQAFDVPFIHIG